MAFSLAWSAPGTSIRRYCARRPSASAAASCMAGAAELMIGEPIRPRRKDCAGFCTARPPLTAAPAVSPITPLPLPLPSRLLYLLDFPQSPIPDPSSSFSCLSAGLAPARLMLGIHRGALGDMDAKHRQKRAGVARQRRIQNLLVLAPRLIAREILPPERQHAIAQALVVHLTMEVQQPARIAA